jgi:hypothetical protein
MATAYFRNTNRHRIAPRAGDGLVRVAAGGVYATDDEAEADALKASAGVEKISKAEYEKGNEAPPPEPPQEGPVTSEDVPTKGEKPDEEG